MKNIAYTLLISSALAHAASSGPLQVGNFDPYVSQTVTNKINAYYLPESEKRNKDSLPSGSVAAMWQTIGEQGVATYFETHKEQLEASALYIKRSNNSELTADLYKRANDCSGRLKIRVVQWELYSLAAAAIFGLLEKETIPELDLKPMTVVGIIEANQDLTFTPEEQTSFGGAIAATISVLNLIYKSDEPAFKKLYEKFLPRTSSGSH